MIELRGVTWNHPRGWGGLRATAEAFVRIRPDVRVEWTERSLQAFADQPVGELAAYDLIVIDHPSIGGSVARSALVPLDEHLGADVLADQQRASVGRSYESYRWGGHQWALPVDASAQVAVWRPDLLDGAGLAPPQTWSDAGHLADALREQDLFLAMPAIPVDAICSFLAACEALGGDPLAGDRRVVDRPVGRTVLEMLASMIGRAHPESLAWDPPGLMMHMAEHDDVAYCPLAFGYVTHARLGFARRPLRFGPGPSGGGGPAVGTLGGAGLAVSSRSAHVDESCAYAAFVTSGDVQRTTYVDGGGQPGHRSAWTDPAVNAAAGGFFAGTLRAIETAYLRPRYDGFIGFQSLAGDVIHRWFREGGNPNDVLDLLDARFRESLRARATGVDR